MTLLDPKSGVGYTSGERLPSAHVNTVWAQQPRALDAISGGSYDLGSGLTLFGSGVVSMNWATVNVGGTWTWTSTLLPALASRQYTRVQPLVIAGTTIFQAAYPSDFFVNVTHGAIEQQYVDVTGSNVPQVQIPLTNLIDLATLQEIRLIVDPAGSSGDPTQKPAIELYSIGSGGRTKIGSTVTDTAANPNYRPEHEIVMSSIGQGITQSNDRSFFVLVTGENGTNATSGLKILGLSCTFDVTQLTPGG